MANIISDILSRETPTVEHSDEVSIDYPQSGEKVNRGHYAIRISAGKRECQVAIDKNPWQKCRSADGFSWYDWSPAKPGAYRISARIRVGNKWVKSERLCTVK